MAKTIGSRRFHAFICYTEEDQSFVSKMADTLDSKPYLLTCVRPDRDFLPGLPVSANIDQHLEASRRIMFVLSDHSMKSPWCRSQIQSILKDREKDVVVVRVGDITPPDYLQHVHTIQATSSMTEIWITKLTRFLGYTACITCEREGKQSKATVYCNNCRHGYCDTCKSQYRRQPKTHLHKMVNITDVDVGPLTAHTDCPDHHKPLELFCKNCKIAICYICSVVSHKQCTVISLTDSVSVLKQSLSTIKDKLCDNIETAMKERSRIEDIERTISQSKDQHTEKVKKEFSDMRSVLDRREKESLKEIQKISDSNVTKVHEKIKVAETEIRSLREKVEDISTALKSQSESTVYETFSEYKNVNTDYKQSRFTEDLTLDEIKVDIDFDNFQCDLSTQEVKCSELVGGDRKMGTPVLHNTQSLGDVGYIHDMCVVTHGESDYIIMASGNNQVHCFDISDSTMISSLSVECRAHSVTAVSDSRVAVSLALARRLLLVDVSPHLSLRSTHKIKNCFYRGLATLTPSTLVACSGYPKSVDILDLTGRVLRSVCTDQQLTTLFSSPWGVCISRTGDIIVTDRYKNCVTCVSDTGEEVFTYLPTGDRKLVQPDCVKCNKAGDVFVVDDSKMVQLTSTGLYVRDVIRRGEEDVGYIYSMCCDSQGNMCVVLNKESDEIVINTYRFT